MKKNELTQRLASQEAITPGAAADQLDEVIFQVLKNLKQGKPATLPGFGRIRRADPKVNRLQPDPHRAPTKTPLALSTNAAYGPTADRARSQSGNAGKAKKVASLPK